MDRVLEIENLLAAITVAKILKIPHRTIQESIAQFRGVFGRREFLRVIQGVSFYNDTCATIPESTIAALRSFPKKVILIAGGMDKNLSYLSLAKSLSSHVCSLHLLPGSATNKLLPLLKKRKMPFFLHASLKQAVETAFDQAKRGEIILFSPASASFGLFKNEFDRGDQYRTLVRNLR